jgi:hypothetical protein
VSDKFEKVMEEFKAGTLRSGSGKKVTSVRQAKAIAANMEAKAKKTAPKPRKAPMRSKSFFLRTG